MVKRLIWTVTAKEAKQEILAYWIKRNGSNLYSKRFSDLFKRRVQLLRSQHYSGKPTDFDDVRATLVNHFTIFYKIYEEEIIVVAFGIIEEI